MRKLLITAVLIIAVAAVGAEPAQAGEQQCGARRDRLGNALQVNCTDDGGAAPEPGTRGGPAEPRIPTYVIGFDDTGAPCIEQSSTPLSQYQGGTLAEDEATQHAAAEVERLFQLGFVPCPGVEIQPITPELFARNYLRTVVLPVPAPQIRPGRMLVGLEAFLETGSPITYQLTEAATPFGPATFDFTSTVTVDWGDGDTTGPVATAGGPYPDGDLTHVYIYDGAYDVVVTQDWTATWTIGPESGTVGGLQTQGTLTDFPVEEREAVIVG